MSTEKNLADKTWAVAVPAGVCRRAPASTAAMRALGFWRQLRAAFADHYRPERHYMRGPGPKWRATHRATALTR
jgi:hypothetical protein